jgi:hypothetical protein
MPYAATGIQTRFLYPFLIQPQRSTQFANFLSKVYSLTHPVWRQSELDVSYTDNLLPHLKMFRQIGNIADFGAYWVLETHVLRHLIRPWQDPSTGINARLNQRRGIELFLNPHGACILSISIELELNGASMAAGRDFHRSYHFGREWLGRDQARVPGIESEIEDLCIPVKNFPTMVEGILGGAIPGSEKGSEFGMTEVQRSFSAYSVSRFSDEIDFSSSQVQQELTCDLLGLSANWPSSHPGVALNSEVTSQSHLLNRNHWCAVSRFGVAHFVADQSARAAEVQHPFNERRVEIASTKLFLSYLYASQQRLSVQAFARDAIELSAASDAADPHAFLKRLAPLKQTMLHFSLRSYAQVLSEEETPTQFYHICTSAFQLESEVDRLHRLFADIDGQFQTIEMLQQTEKVKAEVESQNRLREKFEWVEVFVVTVYAVELAHVLGGAIAPHDSIHHSWIYPGLSLGQVVFCTMFSILSALELWPASAHNQNPSATVKSRNTFLDRVLEWLQTVGERRIQGKRRYALLWIFGSIFLHLALGCLYLKR